MTKGKPWYQSKTMWFNALGALAATADVAVGSGVVGPKAAAAIALGNVFLRAITAAPISTGGR